ncbi:MAG: hypothetical protein IJP93_03220 [Bacteroidales bacterium]|nr:hypothetical protein [Bacteroidales bacterium]
MAETENITILRVGTEEAVRNIQDLKDNIVQLKKDLQGLDIGSEEYSKTLKELNVNQNALRDAMHYTNTEGQTSEQVMNGIANAASGAGNSYNALVAQMKSLREQWRATDDVARRNELGKQINDVNNKLKALDASTGSFKRNVGDYENSIRNAAGAFSAMGSGAAGAIGPINGISGAFKALLAHPIVAVLGLIVAAFAKLTSAAKSTEDGLNGLAYSMSTFQGAGDLFTNLMQNMGSAVSWVAEKIGTLAEKVFPFLQEAAEKRRELASMEATYYKNRRFYMVENANLEAEISEARFKAVDTENYTQKERAKFLQDAMKAQEQILKNQEDLALQELSIARQRASLTGSDTKELDSVAQAEANLARIRTQNAQTMRRLQRELNTLQRETSKSNTEAVQKEVLDTEAALKAGEKARADQFDKRQKENAEIAALIASDSEALAAGIDAMWDAQVEADRRAADEAEKLKEQRKQALTAAVSATSSILGSVADIYESVNAEDEKAAQQTKGLRIAGAIIDTISGAVAAFTSAQSIPPPAGQIIGAANAAAVTAAGIAQIAKIRSTNVSRTSSANTSLSGFSTPTVSTSVPQTTIVRGAQDETLLNQMAQPSRVYILQSDIEAAGKASKARISDTTFE